MAAHSLSLLPESANMSGRDSHHIPMPSQDSKHTKHCLRWTLSAAAVAQDHTQPPHCRPGSMSVLRRQDGSTCPLTAARVCTHVWDRQPSHSHGITGLKTYPALPQINSRWCDIGSRSHPAASLAPKHEYDVPAGWQHTPSHCCQSLYACLGETAITFPWHHTGLKTNPALPQIDSR